MVPVHVLQEKQIVQNGLGEDRRGAEGSVFGPLGPWFLQKHRWEPFDVLILFNAIKSESVRCPEGMVDDQKGLEGRVPHVETRCAID